MTKSRRREEQVVPLIQAVVERQARRFDAFNREEQVVPLIQAVVERQARRFDAFR
jgi:hypothetical protein